VRLTLCDGIFCTCPYQSLDADQSEIVLST